MPADVDRLCSGLLRSAVCERDPLPTRAGHPGNRRMSGEVPSPVLVQFEARDHEYTVSEAIDRVVSAVPRLKDLRFFDVATSSEFGKEGRGLPPSARAEQVGLQLRVARSAVLSLSVTPHESALLKN